MDLLKINVKVFREGKEAWVHFCYVPPNLKREFDELANTQCNWNIWWLNKWAKEQFDIEVDTWEELDILKEAIRKSYKLMYPELYMESSTDNQGWLRVWYTQNMKEELENVGK